MLECSHKPPLAFIKAVFVTVSEGLFDSSFLVSSTGLLDSEGLACSALFDSTLLVALSLDSSTFLSSVLPLESSDPLFTFSSLSLRELSIFLLSSLESDFLSEVLVLTTPRGVTESDDLDGASFSSKKSVYLWLM